MILYCALFFSHIFLASSSGLFGDLEAAETLLQLSRGSVAASGSTGDEKTEVTLDCPDNWEFIVERIMERNPSFSSMKLRREILLAYPQCRFTRTMSDFYFWIYGIRKKSNKRLESETIVLASSATDPPRDIYKKTIIDVVGEGLGKSSEGSMIVESIVRFGRLGYKVSQIYPVKNSLKYWKKKSANNSGNKLLFRRKLSHQEFLLNEVLSKEPHISRQVLYKRLREKYGDEFTLKMKAVDLYRSLWWIEKVVGEKVALDGQESRSSDSTEILRATVNEMRNRYSRYDMTAEALYRLRRRGYEVKALSVYTSISKILKRLGLPKPYLSRLDVLAVTTPSGIQWKKISMSAQNVPKDR